MTNSRCSKHPSLAWRSVLMVSLRLLLSISASLAIHYAGFMGLASIPYNIEVPTQILSIGEYFSDVLNLGLLALPAGICLFTVCMQRGQPDRTSPVVLLALVLGLESTAMCLVGMNEFAGNGFEGYPEDFILASIGVAYFSAGLALVELTRLMLTRSRQRGRWIALSVVVCMGWVGFAQKTMVVDSEGLTAPRNGIVLADVPGMRLRPMNAWGGRKEHLVPLFVDIHADGGIEVDGHAVAFDESAELRDRLALVLAQDPGAVWLRVDSRAPFQAVVRVQAASDRPEVGAWGLNCLVHLKDSRHPGWRVGGLRVFSPSTGPGASEAVIETPERERLVLRMVGSEESPSYEFAGKGTGDLEELLETIGNDPGGWAVDLVLQASPTSQWQSIATLLARLEARDRVVTRFELLD